MAGLVRWLDLRETSLIQPYYDMAELAGLASLRMRTREIINGVAFGAGPRLFHAHHKAALSSRRSISSREAAREHVIQRIAKFQDGRRFT